MRTLDALLAALVDQIEADGCGRCPLCEGRMASGRRVGPRDVMRCDGCGAELELGAAPAAALRAA